MKEKIISEKQLLRKTVFAYAFFILAFAGGILAWKALRQQPKEDAIPGTLRQGLMANENIFGRLFSKHRLAKTFPKSETVQARFNGDLGLQDSSFDAVRWRLQVIKKNGDTSFITLDELKQLPKTDVVFDFKCIEGWSQKTWWGGVKFSDFVQHYHLDAETQLSYAGLSTPDKGYYVGIDMPSMLQPQTLLCYEMNGKALPTDQGYPLRLIIPVKYGIKHLKRIGTIYFSDKRPPDYWAEQGYDYYAGH